MRNGFGPCLGLLVIASLAPAQGIPDGKVPLQPARWRAVRQVLQRGAESTGFHWAVPATLSRRAFLGTADAGPLLLADVLRDLCKQTGLTAEWLNGILVVHEPRVDRVKELASQAAGKDRRLALAAVCALGWMRDVGAWPELARIVCADDQELALAAAQALRRLDGEKPLDWRLHGVSSDDPEFPDILEPAAPWQVPLGSAFPGTVARQAVERLALSPYLPLREAAARLSAALGAEGKGLNETLIQDPSPLVRAAAERTRAAWARPEPVKTPWVKKAIDGARMWWEVPPPDLTAAAVELAKAKEHDIIWRLLGRRVAYQGTPEAMRVMLDYGRSGAKWSAMVGRPLAEFTGGPETIAWLKTAASTYSDYGTHQGWGLWGLSALEDGETLAQSLRPALEGRAHWSAPPEYTAAYGAGIHAQDLLLARLESRGHWVCHGLGYIGGPKAVETLSAQLGHKDPGIAVAAAKGLGDTGALAAVKPLIDQLQHPDRLRRHWAVLGLSRIGGPEANQALLELLREEEKRRDRLVRQAAATVLREIGSPTPEGEKLVARVLAEDKNLVPEYRPRHPRFDDMFPINTEVVLKDHKPVTYCTIGETRAAMDWANRLMFRYGGCTGAYSNECFAFDVGTATWFPIRAADHFCHLFHEVRPNPGCSRGMAYDGVHKLVWIGQGIGSSTGPTQVSHNRRNGLAAYDAALDRFYPCVNSPTMAKAYSGEPSKAFTFDYQAALVVGSVSGQLGISLVDAAARKTYLAKAPAKMPSWDQYRPPAFAYDPVGAKILCTHPDLGWKLLSYDRQTNSFDIAKDPYPGKPSKQIMGGLVYDSLNRAMILIGGISKETGLMPTCVYDRENQTWLDLKAHNLGNMGVGQDTCVYDPEHNVILELIRGAAYRYNPVPVGTKAYYGGGIGSLK